MYVCLCKNITDKKIKEVIKKEKCSFPELKKKLGLCSDCGQCGKFAINLIKDFLTQQPAV